MVSTLKQIALRPDKSGQMPAPEPDEETFVEMTLQEHLEELRSRIMKVVLGIVPAFVIGLIAAPRLLGIIVEQVRAEQGLDILAPTDPFTGYFKVALYIAFGLGLPLIIYQMLAFLSPGLTRQEKRIVFRSLPFVSGLFILGTTFAFFVAAPAGLGFLSRWQSDVFQWSPNVHHTLNFYLVLMFGLGIAFQIPVVMFLLSKLNIVSPEKMMRGWKFALVGILLAAALITPTTDPVNMSIVAAPMLLLYALGIGLARLDRRKSAEKKAKK